MIEHDVPDAHYWNWSIHQLHWFDSGAWDERLMSCNGHQAHVDADGKVRLVVAAHRPRRAQLARHRGPADRHGRLPLRRRAHEAACRPATRRAGRRRAAPLLPAAHPVVDAAARRRAARRPLPRRAAALELSGADRALDARRRRPTGSTRLNAHGAAGRAAPSTSSPLDADELLDAARREHRARRLRRRHLAPALRRAGRRRSSTEAHLTLAGRIVARTELLRALRQRLLLAARVGGRPDDPRRADRRAGVRRRHRPLGHVDPARAARPRPRQPGAADLGAASTRARRSAPTPSRRARGVGHEVHAFWADLQPAYETMHHNDGDEPNECIFATMLEFLSDQWGGTYEVPDLLGAPRRGRPHRRLPVPPQGAADAAAPGARRAVGAQGAEPPRPAAHAVRGLPRRARRPDPPRPAEDRAVDDQPDGHAQVDAVRRRSTSTRSRRWSRWATG